MADFTSAMTKNTTVADSVVIEYNKGAIIAASEELIMDQFATIKEDINAKTIHFPTYSHLALATTALTEGEDLTSVALADDKVEFTPEEYGNVVTTTKLASLQTGGIVDASAIKLVGVNMGQTLDKLAILALEAGTNELTPAGAAESSLTTTNHKITTALMESAYNKLRRGKIPKIGGSYICIMHPDVASDLRSVAAAGDWVDVSKYTNAMPVLRNEIGMFKGFRVIENANITANDGAGDSTTDTYHTLCFGFNAFGKAVSYAPRMTFTGPFDKLGRFVNLGWYGVLKYGIVDQSALWKITTASAFGENS